MNTTFIIISLVLVASVFLPFFLIDRSGKSGTQLIKKESKKEILERKLQVTEREIWGNSFIGVAPDQKKLLFIKFNEPGKTVSEIALETVRSCEIESVIGTLKSGNKREKVLERLDLKLTLYNRPQEVIAFNFYDSDGIFKEDFELARAEKWKRTIDQLKQAQSQMDRVA
ncbi:MAG: hypothetical protein V7724_07960 [Sediminicola sp.]